MADDIYRLEDLAELAGVSISTVSRAVNDSPLVSERTKKKIRTISRNNNYTGRFADQLRETVVSKTISVIIPPPQGRDTRLADPFLLDLIGGIGDALQEQNGDLLISHLDLTDMQSATELVTSGRCEGLIVIGQSTLHTRLNELASHNIPFVTWGAKLPGQQYCSVGSDNQAGGRRGTNHMIRMGRKNIAFVGDIEGPEVKLRFEGYKQALAMHDMPLDQRLVVPAHFYPESAIEALEILIEQGVEFDGVVAASDMIAIGAMRALTNAGLSIPDDVAVIGYDDVFVSAYTSPPLSTIRQDISKAGRLLVSKLTRMLEGEKVSSSTLSTELIIRESCGL